VRIATLCDVHGNLPALQAVLEEVELERPDFVLVGGDVSSGPMPAQTLALLRAYGDRARFVRGNADRVLDFEGMSSLGEVFFRARRWVADQVGDEALAFLGSLPLDEVIEVDGLGSVHFCHGAPGSDTEAITAVTPPERLLPLLAAARTPTVVCGHTHTQFDRRVDDYRVLNAGSVGAPYEDEPGAYWLCIDSTGFSFRRTPYDVEDAIRQIAATGYPGAAGFIELLRAVGPGRATHMSALIEGV
jgi:putative phosphoesterase